MRRLGGTWQSSWDITDNVNQYNSGQITLDPDGWLNQWSAENGPLGAGYTFYITGTTSPLGDPNAPLTLTPKSQPPPIPNPTVCGGGGFFYIGPPTLKFGFAQADLLALVEYDSEQGGSYGGLAGVGVGPYMVGVESMRSLRDWQSTTTPIGLSGPEFENKTPIGPIRPGKIAVGGFVQPAGNKLGIGAYGGAGVVGGGGYLTLGFGGCQ